MPLEKRRRELSETRGKRLRKQLGLEGKSSCRSRPTKSQILEERSRDGACGGRACRRQWRMKAGVSPMKQEASRPSYEREGVRQC